MTVATKDSATKPKLTNAEMAIASCLRDIERTRKTMEWLHFVASNIEPFLPEGCEVSDSMYYYNEGSLEVRITPNEDRQWKGMNGTAGLIVKLRRQFAVPKFTREVQAYPGHVVNKYYGTGMVNDHKIHLTVTMGELPPNCKLEYVDEEIPATTKKVAKVVCA